MNNEIQTALLELINSGSQAARNSWEMVIDTAEDERRVDAEEAASSADGLREELIAAVEAGDLNEASSVAASLQQLASEWGDGSDEAAIETAIDKAASAAMTYTYAIHDGTSVAASSSTAWDRDDDTIEADTLEDAIAEAIETLELAALECRREDGYTPGDHICITLWGPDGSIAVERSLELTEEHLGEAPEAPEETINLDDLSFGVAPVDQGQMVEIAYAWLGDGRIVRRWHDRSDRTTSYDVSPGKVESDDEEPAYSAADNVRQWVPCRVTGSDD